MVHTIEFPKALIKFSSEVRDVAESFTRAVANFRTPLATLSLQIERAMEFLRLPVADLQRAIHAHPDILSDVEDILTLIHFQDDPEAWASERDVAVQHLVHRLSLGLADRKANASLRRICQERGVPRERLLRQDLFPKGVLLAVQTISEPRYIRLGSDG